MIVLLVDIIAIVGLVVAYSLRLIRNPELCVWPRITHCQICNKSVYAWQKHERRPFNVVLDNPDNHLTFVSASGIVHSDCEGKPDFPVSVKVTTA